MTLSISVLTITTILYAVTNQDLLLLGSSGSIYLTLREDECNVLILLPVFHLYGGKP